VGTLSRWGNDPETIPVPTFHLLVFAFAIVFDGVER
jgi:hypothetical protein